MSEFEDDDERRSVKSWVPELRSELILWTRLKIPLLLSLPLLLMSGIAYSGSRGAVASRAAGFEELAHQYQSQGLDISTELAKPVAVVDSPDGSQTIDNPLKYDFIELSNTIRSTEPMAMPATALDITTFLMLPLLFLLLGAWSAVIDRSHSTILWRASRTRWRNIPLAKISAIVLMAVLAASLTAVFGLLVGTAGQFALGSMQDVVDYPLAHSTPRPFAAKWLMAVVVASIFGVAGYVIGGFTRSFSWPIIVCSVILLVVPYAGRWDPRNIMTIIGANVFDFWGSFSLRPPVGVPPSWVAVYSVFSVIGLALLSWWVSYRPRIH